MKKNTFYLLMFFMILILGNLVLAEINPNPAEPALLKKFRRVLLFVIALSPEI